MNTGWVAYNAEDRRDAKVVLHPGASIREVRLGTATEGIDITELVLEGSQGLFETSVTLTWNYEVFGIQPKPGWVLEVQLWNEGLYKTAWLGIVESLSGITLSRGARRLQLIARTSETQEIWKTVKRVTPLYPQMTNFTVIAQDIAKAVGLLDDEIFIPLSSYSTAHSNTQLADMTAWEMMNALFLPLGLTPFIDGVGRLRGAKRDIQGREADYVFPLQNIESFTGSRNKPPVNRYNLQWLNPELKKSYQQGRKLNEAIVTTGWFIPYMQKTVWFSDDKSQRAEGTHMVIKQSANGMWVPVCLELYEQTEQNAGVIRLINLAFAPTLAYLIWQWHAAHSVPDGVQTVPLEGTGETIPIGRKLEAAAQYAILMILLSIGTGIYEIWGTPYDWVHARNSTIAFDQSAPMWVDNPKEEECDFVMNESHAQAIAVRELIYLNREAQGTTVRVLDTPQLEFGDIVQFPDGTKVYVLDIKRNLKRGSEPLVDITGFLANGTATAQASLPIDTGSGSVVGDGGGPSVPPTGSSHSWLDLQLQSGWGINFGGGSGTCPAVITPGTPLMAALYPTGAYQDDYVYKNLGGVDDCTHFTYEALWSIPNAADLGKWQGVEADLHQSRADGWSYTGGVQLIAARSGAAEVRIYDLANEQWVAVPGLVMPLTDTAAHRVRYSFHNDHVAHQTIYDSLTIDNVTVPLNNVYGGKKLNWASLLNVAVQLDGDSDGDSYTVAVNDWNVYAG